MSGEHRSKSYHALLKSYPDSRKVNAVSEGAEVLYLRLLAASDDRGRYWGEPVMLARKLFARRASVTESDVASRLAELESVGLVRRYRADGEVCLELVGIYRPLKNDRSAQIAFPAPGEPVEPERIQSGSTVDPRHATAGNIVQVQGEVKGQGEVQGKHTRAAKPPPAEAPPSDAGASGPPQQEPQASTPKRTRKQPTGDHAALMAWWATAWEEARGIAWSFSGKDGAAAQRLLKLAHGDLAAIKARGDRMLCSTNRWHAERASLAHLAAQWNELGVEILPAQVNGSGGNGYHRPNGRRAHKSIHEHLAEGTLILSND